MPKCPKCNEEITTLSLIQSERNFYEFNAQGSIYERELINQWDKDFKCPKCDEGLFDNEDDALSFLNNGKEGGKNGGDEIS